jgi:recombinational DNA repair protein RecT
MSNQLQVIETKINSADVTNQLIVALGLKESDENARNEAFRYASSVMSEIAKTAGDDKKDLTVCTPDSIVRCMIDAASFKLPIDGKQLAHIVKYGKTATLQIGYRGYIAKISEHFKDADFTATPVFDGDKLTVTENGNIQDYTLERKNPFADDWKDLQGVIVSLGYSKGGERFKKITTVSKADLTKIRASAKQDYIWAKWPIEKAKAAAIKRACKIQFADVMGLQEVIRYDNEVHFDQEEQPAAPVRKSIVDNINASIAPEEQPTIEHEESEKTYTLIASSKEQFQLASVQDWKTKAVEVVSAFISLKQCQGFAKANEALLHDISQTDNETYSEIMTAITTKENEIRQNATE